MNWEEHEKVENIKKIIEDINCKLENLNVNSKQIEKSKKELFIKLCLKEYLEECDPTYCFFRITNSCEYIKVLMNLNKKFSNDRFSYD